MGSPTATTTLILARHGEAEYEATYWDDEGGSLTPRGREQAASLAAALADRCVTHVWTSTLARAVQTGEIVAATLGVAVTTRAGLREFGCGDFAGVPLTDDPFVAVFSAWADGDLATTVPGGESGHDVLRRMRTVLAQIVEAHPGETVLVVSHGGVLSISGRVLLDTDGVVPEQIPNCGTIEVEVGAGGWVCRRWG